MTDAEALTKALGWEIVAAGTPGSLLIFKGFVRHITALVGRIERLDSWEFAGLVVEEMRRRGYRLRLSDYGDEWWATLFFKTPEGRNDWVDGSALVPPAAIFAATLAVLRAAESEDALG